ncbi:hypothetical protein J056_004589 [Wallemia ichthyophaga EXF-994]|uniref:Uncharacterized protein n=1 Tax=Wallemia ichthyophaga (strain EXF-994 / CBS 113033) TaxID=1299270 RepID=R9AGF9_WALI9|nr:uncharacterized protein J056_004589 [Wallemia ichthyophaga EXF-994]EOR01268.1 hypothetical protein J056_004589 [Wallemia ichthyophaga EXF-994]TIA71123.1 hypothetical protein E3P91_02724 [Wallemia ichthyophaga]
MTSRHLQNMQKQFYNLNQQLNSPCHNFEKVEAPITTVPNSKLKLKRWVHNNDLTLDLSDDEHVDEVINIDESDPNTQSNNTQANSPTAEAVEVEEGVHDNTINTTDPSAAANQVIHPNHTEHLHQPLQRDENGENEDKDDDDENDVKREENSQQQRY